MRNAALGLYHKPTDTSTQIIQIHILLLPVLVSLSNNSETYRADGFAIASTLYASAGSHVTARNTMTAPTICC
jgi:hypothetical protein